MGLLLLAAVQDLVLSAPGAYEIVREERALPVVSLAARELQLFVERSSGVKLPIMTAPTPGKGHVFVGTAAGLRPEGFRIRAVGRDLRIEGDDSPGDPERIRRERPVRCGTLFGVYEFLERFAGVVFAWHDDLGTVAPPRAEIRVPADVEIVQAPDWTSRTIINTPPGSTSGLFGRRLRLGASVETDYTHHWHRILPVDPARPEFFALVKGERRTSYYLKNHGGQVCTSNPDVIELFARAAIEHFAKNPADGVFPISPNDGKGFCECEPCRAQDPLSDRILAFYNAVAERVVRAHPTKKLGGFVYARYARPPVRVKPHPSLLLAHATNSAHAQGMGWAREREDERAWTALSKGMVKYDIWYYGEYGSMGLPAPATAHLAEKLKAEHDAGFAGGYLYAAPAWELLGAGHYLMAKLMWDRNADVPALEKRYFDALYGAAGPDVLEYYRLLETALRKARLEGIDRAEPIVERALGWTGDDETSAAFTIAAYFPILDTASAILARPRALPADERARLDRLRRHHDHLVGTVRAMVAAGRLEAGAEFRPEDLAMFRGALALRDPARDGIPLISPSGPLARLARENATVVGPRVALTRTADVCEADVMPGRLYRLSIARHAAGVLPLYDHTRESPLVRFLGRPALPRLGVPALGDADGIQRFVLEIPPGLRRLRFSLSFPLPGRVDVTELALAELRTR
jgi:hypothetical protein